MIDIKTNGAVYRNAVTHSGAPAARINAANVRFTNTDSGRLVATSESAPALLIQGAGAVVVNELGGVIRTDDFNQNALYDEDAIVGSAFADTIVNQGLIVGEVRLGAGNDSYTHRTESVTQSVIDLGSGDDLYWFEADDTYFIQRAAGGDGFDRVILAGPIGQIDGSALSGFERLEVGPDVINVQQFSGYSQVVLAPEGWNNFLDSANPAADLTVRGGGVTVGPGSVFDDVYGTGAAETVQIGAYIGGHGTILGDVGLGAGNDVFWFSWTDGGSGPVIGGIVSGGTGNDTVHLDVTGHRTIDLSDFSGFEELDTGNWSSPTSQVRVTHADGFRLIRTDHGGSLTLAHSSSPEASLYASVATVLLEETVTIGTIGYYHESVADQAQGNDALSTSITNRGAVLGNVFLGVGDDLYDGRAGSTGGTIYGYAGNDRLYGGAEANRIEGGFGADRLDGGGGADTLLGGGGNDIYVVNHAGDTVVEEGSSGVDTVESSVGYSLPTHFEKLVLTGAVGVDGRGNSGANTITGNSGRNFLNGGSGNDVIDAGAGNDRLLGSLGNDSLRGGAGSDRFEFTTALGAANVDKILDFSVPADSVYLHRSVFTRAGANGTLAPGAFHKGAAAADASDRIVYDSATGKLFYDADGSGAAAAILFATVTPGTALTNADFIIYG